MRMKKYMSIAMLSLLVVLAPRIANCKLMDILANELNYDMQVQELDRLQRKAQFDYSDEYANYQLDMKELKKRRDELLKALRSEETRQKIERAGKGIEFQLRFYTNLTVSLINIQQRIHHLLALKDLRMDVLDRLPVLVEKHNAILRKMIMEDEASLKKIKEKQREIKKAVHEITKKKKSEITPDDIRKLKMLYARYKEAEAQKKHLKNSIARKKLDIENSTKSLATVAKVKENLNNAFSKLEAQRTRLLSQVINLKRDLQAMNVNTSTEELIRKVSTVWGEVNNISADLGQFVANYAELETFQTALQLAQSKREEVTLEKILGSASKGSDVPASDAEILEWARSIQ